MLHTLLHTYLRTLLSSVSESPSNLIGIVTFNWNGNIDFLSLFPKSFKLMHFLTNNPTDYIRTLTITSIYSIIYTIILPYLFRPLSNRENTNKFRGQGSVKRLFSDLIDLIHGDLLKSVISVVSAPDKYCPIKRGDRGM